MVKGFSEQAKLISQQINSYKRQQLLYKQADSVEALLDKTSPDKKLSPETREKLVALLGSIAMTHQDDPSLKGAVEASITGASLPAEANFGEYVPYLESILGNIAVYREALPDDAIADAIKTSVEELEETKKIFIKGNIQSKHQKNVTFLFDKFIA
ncbi:hypothetical protein SDC9_174379 [bioreactor metagenome]|uniref:Uncharacterized protein n=1 Tax=bioreactor metagenome TaxID=1076179 RepID=A0A645GTI7_9ZZZZ